jgi:hypothetical protein
MDIAESLDALRGRIEGLEAREAEIQDRLINLQDRGRLIGLQDEINALHGEMERVGDSLLRAQFADLAGRQIPSSLSSECEDSAYDVPHDRLSSVRKHLEQFREGVRHALQKRPSE